MDDEWSQLPIDPNTGVKVISIGGSNPLPVMPSAGSSDDTDTPAFGSTDVGTATSAADVETGPLAKLFGTAGNERYQTWPEKLVRSAVTAPADAISGALPMIDPETGHTSDAAIQRSLDVASLAGVGPLAIAPGEATLGSGMVRAVKGFESENWYHGTTHEFSKFDLKKGNPENYLGQYPHFTNSPEDASANYAGHGPDLTNRIENLAEQKYLPDEMPAYGTDEYKQAYAEAKQKAAAELAGPHEGAVIPAELKLDNPVNISDKKPTWLDFNAKYNKDGDWVKDNPNTTKLLNSFKKYGDQYGFNGQQAFDEVAEKASLYDGDIKASDLNKAIRENNTMMDASDNNGKLVNSHIAANIFKDLGYDGIVMDAKTAFPNMKNIPEGTLHAVPLKKNTVFSKLSGNKLYSDTGKPGMAIGALEHSGPAPVFYSAVENAVKDAKLNVGTADQWLGYLKNQPGVKQEELDWTLGDLPTDQKLTKQDVQAHVDANKVQVQDVNKGNAPATYNDQGYPSGTFPEGSTTKFQSYQLPGASNYQEKLLTLPAKKVGETSPEQLQNLARILYETYDRKGGEPLFKDLPAEKQQEYLNTAKQKSYLADNPGFKSSHWDEPNVLAHVRMNDRNVPTDAFTVQNIQSGNRGPIFNTEAEAKAYQDSLSASIKTKIVPTTKQNKTLHLEEIQSDWHQKGRVEGYKITPEQKTQLEALDNKLTSGLSDADIGNPDMKAVLQTAQDKGILTAQEAKNYADWSKGENSSIPNAPFKTSWSDLALKRMIRHAAENGYDAISWTPGEAQAARYDLSKHIKEIEYYPVGGDSPGTSIPNSEKRYVLGITQHNGEGLDLPQKSYSAKELSDVVGKEVAQKIIDGEGKHYRGHDGKTLEGLDLKVGGEGMKAFYDKMLVDKANNIAKKYGGRVEDKDLLPKLNLKDYEAVELKKSWGSEGWNVRKKGTDEWKYVPIQDASTAEEAIKQLNLHNNKGVATQPIHFLKLPQGLKDTALSKGFPLFSGGFPITPVSGNPFQENVEVNGKTIPVNNKQDVPDLAGASSDSDTVNVDKSVPRYDPKFKVANGQPGDIYKYLAIHETTEKAEMEKQIGAFTQKNGRQPNAEEMHRIYLNAHYGTATPNEHAAIIADGGNPKDYEDVLHGYERKTENEKSGDIPQNLYRKVYDHNQLRNFKMTPVKGNPFQ